MSIKISQDKNKVKLSNEFYFEIDNLNLESKIKQENFLGWEHSIGKIRLPLLQKYFPNCNVSFFPIMQTSLQENCIIKNLDKLESFLLNNQNTHILIDWPESLNDYVSKILKSFPHCITFVPQDVFEKNNANSSEDNLLKQLQNEPIIFMESLDTRRHILKILQRFSLSINCIGSIESFLQWKLYNQNISSHNPGPELIISGGLTPWFQKIFENSSPEILTENLFIKNTISNSCRNILQFISKNNSQNILIISGIELLKNFSYQLSTFNDLSELENFISSKIINLNDVKIKNNSKHFIMTQPSSESIVDYISIPGFFAKDILEEKELILSWIDFAKKSYAKAFINASNNYVEWTKFKITPSQERDYFRFSYRLSFDRGLFFPNIFEMLLAANSVIDSNFAYEFLKECKDMPNNPLFEGTLSEIKLPLSRFFKHTSKISISKFETIQSNKKIAKAKIQSVQKQKQNQKIESVSEEKYADNNWVNEDHPYSCSFPSEDIFMENLALNIKSNMQNKIRSQDVTLQELQADFYDGLDIRETIKNWHKEKIIVKDIQNTGKADIGAVVFSFIDPSKEQNYSWRSFWLAEQHDDSNLMFYATPFKDNLIGPGIAKSEFGGFAVIPLPSATENPWDNPFILHFAKNATECLILAGALATNHRSILFISNHPPSQHISKILKQSRKSIIYAKLDEFSQDDIRMVRTFHILAEAGVREYAKKYIRKDS